QVVWVRRVSSPLLIVGVPVAVLLQRRRRKHESGWRSTIQTALVAVITVCLGIVRVVINDEALTVGFGPWGWPQRHFRLATVTHATVDPGVHWGRDDEARALRRLARRLAIGIGLRFVPHGIRLVLGFGDMLVIHLTNGRTFGVTVP